MKTALSSYLRVIRVRWRWILWGVLIALAITTVGLFIQPQTYRSDAMVFVRTPGDISRVMDGGSFYAQERAKTYAALANSPSVSARVIADLGLHERADDMVGRIKASNPRGTALVNISVTASSAAEAQRTATVFLTEYSATVRDLEAVPGSLVPRAELVVVDPPSSGVREVTWGLPIPLVLLGVTLIGLVLGATAAVVRSAFDASPRDRMLISDAGELAEENEREVKR